MAHPRVFISSTFYDLKHIRASLEAFIESLGFDAVLSEQGNVPYDPSIPLDESCYREVETVDLFVLIIGGRYGSEASATKIGDSKEFFDRYESITKTEYARAVERDIPVYILIERAVYAEYQTFQRNKSNAHINYAHADSVNVFLFIEEILGKRRNNPYFQFDRYSEIQSWLQEQWAGRFRDMLNTKSSQMQLTSLAEQVRSLTELGRTLKIYIEKIATQLASDKSQTDKDQVSDLIASENKRLKDLLEAHEFVAAVKNDTPIALLAVYGVSPATTLDIFRKATTQDELLLSLKAACPQANFDDVKLKYAYQWNQGIAKIRKHLNLPPLQ